MKKLLLLLTVVVIVRAQTNCDPAKCLIKNNCRCMLASGNPGGIDSNKIPQLVMLTFDDNVNTANIGTYKELFLSGKKNPSGCNIGATFFVAHDYNNYAHLHHLWGSGSEIAVHTITHETNTEMWKTASYERLKNETVGMRDIISLYAEIPKAHIQGYRSPFLQTAGDTTYEMLKKEGFMYDSSLATRSVAGLQDGQSPAWPFTLDSPLRMDCIVRPCPTKSHPGVWLVPLVSYFKKREGIQYPCAMADACLPFPTTQQETFDYFMENFNRHYKKNRAPFPVFLHESWLRDKPRRDGYMQFFNYLMGMKDVYIVPIQEVLQYIKDPVTLDKYKEKRCLTTNEFRQCDLEGNHCEFKETKAGGPRDFYTCTIYCPENFPWLNQLE